MQCMLHEITSMLRPLLPQPRRTLAESKPHLEGPTEDIHAAAHDAAAQDDDVMAAVSAVALILLRRYGTSLEETRQF